MVSYKISSSSSSSVLQLWVQCGATFEFVTFYSCLRIVRALASFLGCLLLFNQKKEEHSKCLFTLPHNYENDCENCLRWNWMFWKGVTIIPSFLKNPYWIMFLLSWVYQANNNISIIIIPFLIISATSIVIWITSVVKVVKK